MAQKIVENFSFQKYPNVSDMLILKSSLIAQNVSDRYEYQSVKGMKFQKFLPYVYACIYQIYFYLFILHF